MALSSKTNKDFKITGNWEVLSKELQKKFPQLTETDLKFEATKDEELLKRIETRLGKKREDVISILTKMQTEAK
ncbi:hypothetical protein AD998_20445 [bacterium 336/3]|nr:hypothetical protein AD998_20445 [bacterium 336/3]